MYCHTLGLLFGDLRTCNRSESQQIHIEMFPEKRGGDVEYNRAKNHRNDPTSGCVAIERQARAANHGSAIWVYIATGCMIIHFQEASEINAETTPESIFIIAI